MKLSIKSIKNSKNHYLLFLIMFVVIYIFYSQIFPYRLWRMEEDNFFVLTSDFTKSVLTSPAGVAEWIGLWLVQWYRNVIVGILIHSTLLVLLGIISFFTFKENKLCGGLLGVAALPVAATIGASFYGHSPVMIVSQIVFWAALLLFYKIKNSTLRIILFAFLLPILFFLLPGGVLLLLYIIIAISELKSKNRSLMSWSYAILTLIAVSLPLLWNLLFFEPLAIRYSMFTNATVPNWLTILLFLPAIFTLFSLSKVKQIPFYWSYIGSTLLLIITCTILDQNKVFKNAEESYHLEYLAENRMWNRIVKRGMGDEQSLYDLRMKYSVLSLIELNKLPELLFSLPITPMFEYSYQSPNSRMTYGFNSRFYKSLNLTNEAMRFFFQDACMSDYGMNFRVIRNLAQCAKISGNDVLARKYLSILSKSNQDTKELETFINDKREESPHLPQLFRSSTDINTIKRVISSNYSTTSINDCLLCYLLIQKDLKTFAQVASFCLTTPELVRGCYKEAALLCKINNIPCNLDISEEALRAYDDLMKMMNIGDSEGIERKFAGSYLRYFFSEIEVNKL